MSLYNKIILNLSIFNILFCIFELGRISAGAHMSFLSAFIILAISIVSFVDAFKPSQK